MENGGWLGPVATAGKIEIKPAGVENYDGDYGDQRTKPVAHL